MADMVWDPDELADKKNETEPIKGETEKKADAEKKENMKEMRMKLLKIYNQRLAERIWRREVFCFCFCLFFVFVVLLKKVFIIIILFLCIFCLFVVLLF